jgi:uncharacterized protein (TIGR02147 family)
MAAVVEGEAPDLFSFTDYREFLRRYYEFRRHDQPTFSYRFMATRLEIDPGQLAHILQGKLHLPQRALAATLRLCRFDARQSAFFEELIRLGRSRTPEDAARSEARLDALRKVSHRELGPKDASFYGHWRHSVLRALTSVVKVSEGGELGAFCQPCQSPADARESIQLLERLGLLARDEAGCLRPTEAHLAPGSEISRAVLRKWHAEVLKLATESLERFDPAQRDISTLTVALSSRDLPTVRGWIADLRQQAQAQAEASKTPDRVLEICIQIFPVAQTGAKKSNRG